jgi:hypothetical protein
VLRSTLSTSAIKKTNLLMMYKAKVAVCSESHTKHINVITMQNFLMLNLVLRKVTGRV